MGNLGLMNLAVEYGKQRLNWYSDDSATPMEVEMGPEDIFKHKVVIPALKEIPMCDFFIKEAGSIRAIADIIGNVKGQYFAWELKKDAKEASKTTGRIVLQKYKLEITNTNGGIGRIVHPDNLEECLNELRSL